MVWGRQRVIFARSNRSMILFAWGAAAAAVLLLVGALALLVAGLDVAAFFVGIPALVAAAVVLRTLLRLRRWPAGRLGFFRDRLVLVRGRATIEGHWDLMEGVTLAEQGDWAAASWPAVTLTDRLTVRLRPARRFSFRPAAFGVDPAACRDLMLRLRDDPALRQRLPEFSSELDLLRRPLRTGELIRPEL
jgi:hypothetical protein